MLLWYYGDKCGQGATKGLLETLYFGNDGGGGEKQRGKGRGAKEQVLVESGLRMGLCCGLRGHCGGSVPCLGASWPCALGWDTLGSRVDLIAPLCRPHRGCSRGPRSQQGHRHFMSY